jgi:hypothetical protein
MSSHSHILAEASINLNAVSPGISRRSADYCYTEQLFRRVNHFRRMAGKERADSFTYDRANSASNGSAFSATKTRAEAFGLASASGSSDSRTSSSRGCVTADRRRDHAEVGLRDVRVRGAYIAG